MCARAALARVCLKWRLVSNKRRDVRVVRSYVGIGTRKIIINVKRFLVTQEVNFLEEREYVNGLIFRDVILSRIYVSDFRFQLAVREVLLNKAFYKKALLYSNTKRARACVRSFYSAARECVHNWLREERRFRVLSAQTTTNESFEVCASRARAESAPGEGRKRRSLERAVLLFKEGNKRR